MQVRRHNSASKQKRRGFTLIELLVVISIIATLMSLILPAIQNAREAGRRTQCLNNIRNVTIATLNFASSNKSRLPALSYYPLADHDNDPTTPDVMIQGRSWVIELLPFMDHQGTYDRWNKDLAFTSTAGTTVGGTSGGNLALASNLYVEALACPNDDSAFQVPGQLSYVANAGFGNLTRNNLDNSSSPPGVAVNHSFFNEPFDWDGDGNNPDPNTTPVDTGDRAISKALGVFSCEFGGIPETRNSSASIGKIYDGSGNTLMFGENLNATVVNFADPNPDSCGFMFPLDDTLVGATTISNPLPAIATSGSSSTAAPAFPNEAKAGPVGTPYLNSNHPGIVVVSFCDGSARTISEDIDEGVYVSLITADGTRLRTGITPEAPLSADSF